MADKRRIAPASGAGLRLAKGEVLRIIDPEGEQVSDVVAYAADDLTERFSTGRTIDYAESIRVTTGGVLYSNWSRAMLTIVADTVGVHDLLLTPCSTEMFRILYGQENHPSCFENLAGALAEFGVGQELIAGALNVFMNVPVGPDGKVRVETPASKAGDYIELRAEMDLIVALTACSSEHTNNGRLKPIDFEVLAPDK
ncbi:MAG: urea carboxylase-associated family protein [Chloroflexota bacterium]